MTNDRISDLFGFVAVLSKYKELAAMFGKYGGIGKFVPLSDRLRGLGGLTSG
jgi:hypothetical protein